jgi:hypothetical protein
LLRRRSSMMAHGLSRGDAPSDIHRTSIGWDDG